MENRTLNEKVLTGVRWQYLSVAIQAVSRLMVLVTLARFLSPKEFGVFGIAVLFTSFAERVGQVGVGPAIVQREEITEAHLQSGFSISLIFGVLLFAILYLLAPWAAEFFDEPDLSQVLRAMSLLFVIESFGMVSEALLQRKLGFREIASADNLSYILGSGVIGISLAMSGFGVWSLVVSSISARAFRVGALLWYEPRFPTLRLRNREGREMVNLGVGYSLVRILNYMAIQGDNFVVGRMLGSSALGFYSRAYQLMVLPATYFGQVLDRVLFPALSRKQNDPEGLQRGFLYCIELMGVVGVPMSVFMFFGAGEIVLVLFGENWRDIIPVLRILSIGIFFRLAYKSSDMLIRSLGVPYQHAVRQATYATSVIVGSLVGSRWGIEGVGVAVLIAVVANYGVMSWMTLTLVGISLKQFFQRHLPALWNAAILTPLTWILFSSLDSLHLPLPFRLLLGGGIFLIFGMLVPLFAPRMCRLTVSVWLSSNVVQSKQGAVWRIMSRFLSRVSQVRQL